MARLHAIVGDIHGCLDALKRLEDRIARHAAREGLEPVVVSVGDLVDRGPDSAGVVRHLRRGVAAGTHVALLGNHEELMLASIDAFAPDLLQAAGLELHPSVEPLGRAWDRKDSKSAQYFPRDVFEWFRTLMWLAQGGAPTLASFGTEAPTDPETWQIDPEDLAFLNALPVVFEADSVVVTHALTSAEGLAALRGDDVDKRRQATEQALWGRALPEARPDPDRTHVSGHTVIPKGVRRRRDLGLVQVDTGAFLGGRLSCWCAETDRVITVRA